MKYNLLFSIEFNLFTSTASYRVINRSGLVIIVLKIDSTAFDTLIIFLIDGWEYLYRFKNRSFILLFLFL
jgi:hypothetical protein